MDAGELRTRVAILTELAPTQNSYGEEVSAPVERMRVWADVTPQTGREDFRAGKTEASLPVRVAMRSSPQIRPRPDEQIKVLSGPMAGVVLEIHGAAELRNEGAMVVLNCRQVGMSDGA